MGGLQSRSGGGGKEKNSQRELIFSNWQRLSSSLRFYPGVFMAVLEYTAIKLTEDVRTAIEVRTVCLSNIIQTHYR